MQNTPPSIVNFNRDDSPATVNLDSFVVIARNSVLSYAAAPADTTNDGIIQLCGTNSGTGRPIILIQDGGSFVVAGHTITEVVESCPTIDRTSPSGRNAILNITADAGCNVTPGATPHFYWAIQNQNTIWPELLIDPFFNQDALLDPFFIGTFNGLRYGFVLGADGILTVESGAYLWYEGQANNVCPPIDCIPGINCPGDLTDLDELVNCPCDNQTQSLIKERNPSAFIVDGSLNPALMPARINLGIQSGIFFLSTVDDDGNVTIIVPPHERTPGAGEIVFDVEGPLDVVGSNMMFITLSYKFYLWK
jgi:hypothetical protein